ncbi:MAG: YncE family protein [Bacteroides sp.]|nr:YncE family protein [Bacteroides sp.]MCM1379281.1 YncE family protein [Bacteroides sp.]MCM1445061.1 YncE family protein [Prevotella sp.]
MPKAQHLFIACALMLASCAEDPQTPGSEAEDIDNVAPGGDVKGFYLLNEGNMGSNKCTLDYFDYTTETYYRNIYAERNPNEVMELGDTGNDLAIYGDSLYIVVNGSHKVEVLNATSAKKVTQINVNSPRYIAFDGSYAYVSSYVGGQGDKGSVVKIDLASMSAVASLSVGYCPEEMAVVNGKLYVANSYLYSAGIFDNTISVIDLENFTVSGSIEVAPNLHHLKADEFGRLWVSSRGNYADVASNLFMLSKVNGEYAVTETVGKGCTDFTIGNGKLYFYSTGYDENRNASYDYDYLNLTASGFTDANKSFLSADCTAKITTPYCLAIQPATSEILVTDVANYVSSGKLLVSSADGAFQWEATTGDIPGHIAFLIK